MAEVQRPDTLITTTPAGSGPAASAPTPAPGVSVAPAKGNGFILVVSGPSGAGKGTLLAYLFKHRPDCVFSVSATTRPRRSTEVEGREYLFMARDEFLQRRDAGQFLEWAEVHGNLYGTPVSEVNARIREGKVVVLDVDVQGGASMRRVRPDAVSVFLYPPSLDALHQRLLSRGTDSSEVIEHRLGNAPGEIAQWTHYDYVIMNDRLDIAQAQLLAIHDAEYMRPHKRNIF
jgi:guanylate kinase